MNSRLRFVSAILALLPLAIACGGGGTDPGGGGSSGADTVAIALRDTVSGTLTDAQDADFLAFSLTAGDLFRVYAKGGQFQVFDPTGAGLDFVHFFLPEPPQLLGSSTGLLQAAVTGTYYVRATANGASNYRIFVYNVNTAPETAGVLVVAGDSIVSETLDAPGDIDIFTLQVPPGTDTLNLVDFVGSQFGDSLRIQILSLDSTSLFYQWRAAPIHLPQIRVGGSGPVVLAGGTYRISVNRLATGTFGAPVPFKLRVNRVSAATELGSDSLVFGVPTVAALDPVGDLDVYRVHGVANQSFIPQFQGFSPGVIPPGFTAFLQAGEPLGDPLWVGSPPRLTLPADSVYAFTVTPTADGRDYRQQGPYTLTLVPADTLPEGAPSVVSLGVTINTEGVGTQSDLDRFSVAAPPGSEVQLLFRSLGPQSQGELLVAQWLGESGDTLLGEQAALTTTWGLGRRVTPPSGKLRFQFGWQRNNYGAPKLSDLYEFAVVPINRAPEIASPTLLLEDTVSTEGIEPIGDIDEFQYAGTAGEVIRVFTDFDLAFYSEGGVIVEIIAPGQPTPFLTDSTFAQAHVPPYLTPSVALPANGTYTIRVLGVADRTPHGAYRIAVVP